MYRAVGFRLKPLLVECPVRKICQELKEKYTSKIITDDSGARSVVETALYGLVWENREHA